MENINVFFFIPIAAIFLAFFVSLAMCALIIRHRDKLWLDHPNDRSLHIMPLPRIGGVAICSGIVIAVLMTKALLVGVINLYGALAAGLLLAVALIDDRNPIHPLVRFFIHAIVASLLVWGGNVYLQFNDGLPWVWPCIGVLVLMWSINLYNFMDGMDGFAGSMGLIGFAALSILGFMQEQAGFAVLCAIIAAACAGFLCFNFPPARLFMGDSGSTVLGLAMGWLSIQGWRLGVYPFWIPAIIFSPFWVDATFTLLKRLLRGEKIWLPHRQHFYQRWVLAGYTHRQVTGFCALLMLACSASVILWQNWCVGRLAVWLPSFWIVCYGSIAMYSKYRLPPEQCGSKG